MGCNSSKDVQVDDTKKAPLPKEDTNRNTKVETNKQNGKSVKSAPRKGQPLLKTKIRKLIVVYRAVRIFNEIAANCAASRK